MAYLNITSANFQQDPYRHFEDYRGHINTNCSISIRYIYIYIYIYIYLSLLIFIHLFFCCVKYTSLCIMSQPDLIHLITLPSLPPPLVPSHPLLSLMDSTSGTFKKELTLIVKGDPLVVLTQPQKELLWKFRKYCSTIPEALPKLLRCVQWGNLEQVIEVHQLIRIWQPITLEVALELLDYHFGDEKVRSLAVKRLEKLSNGELKSFLLQLVQVILREGGRGRRDCVCGED